MPSTNGGHYDQSLLAAAPQATKTQLQEGYNPDLLNESANPPPRDIESGHASKEFLGTHTTPVPPRIPFWRTTKGLIIIAVAAIVIIGAVVGGAVGGTVGKKDNKTSDNGSLETGGNAGQEAGSAPITSQQPTSTSATSQPVATDPAQPSPDTSAQNNGGNGGGAGNTGNTGNPGNPFNPPAAGSTSNNIGNPDALNSVGNAIPASPPTIPPTPPDSLLGIDSLS